MKKYFAICVMLFTASTTYAAATLSGKTIKTTHVNTNTGFYFRTVETMENPDNCTSSAWYHIKTNGLYSKEAFSVVLSAHVAGKKVQFVIDGCDNGYPAVQWLNAYDQ